MQRLADSLVFACRIISGAALLAMMSIVFLEIVLRNFAGTSLQMSDELAGYLLVTLAFFGFSVAYRDGALMRIEVVYGALPPRARIGLDIAIDIAAFAAIVAVDIFVIRFVSASFSRGTVAPTLLQTPLWIPQLAIPVGLTLLALAIACSAAGRASSLVGRR